MNSDNQELNYRGDFIKLSYKSNSNAEESITINEASTNPYHPSHEYAIAESNDQLYFKLVACMLMKEKMKLDGYSTKNLEDFSRRNKAKQNLIERLDRMEQEFTVLSSQKNQ